MVVAVTACGTLGMHMIIPALPATAQAFRVSESAIQLTITLYLVGLAVGQLVYGPLSDRFGRRPVLIAGLALFTAAGAVTVLAPSAGALVAARVAQSLGGCAGLVLGRAIVRDSAPPDRAAAQLALLTLVMSMAPAIAPAIGGYATAFAGWRASFAMLAAIGATTTLLAVRFMPETNAGTGLGRSMLMPSLRLLRSRAFRGFAIGGACTTTSFYAFMAASPFIFIDLLHQTEQQVGLYYLVLMLGVATGGLLGNRLAGRMRLSRVLRLANGLAIAGASGFMLADLTGHLTVAVGGRHRGAVHGWRRACQPVRADRRDLGEPAGDRRRLRPLRVRADDLRRALHRGRRDLASGLGADRRGGAARLRARRPGGIFTRGAAPLSASEEPPHRLDLLGHVERRRVPAPGDLDQFGARPAAGHRSSHVGQQQVRTLAAQHQGRHR